MNSSNMISSAEIDAITLEDELADFTADLLALKSNEHVLQRLFSEPAGVWSDVGSFVESHQTSESLKLIYDGALQVTWLDHPELDSGYCLVLFYADSVGWNNLAIYNKANIQ